MWLNKGEYERDRVQSGAAATGLSQWQRVANIFTAPSKTFEDIKRGNRSWWMPFVIMAIVGYIFLLLSIKIGMQKVVENQIQLDPEGGRADGASARRSSARRH